MAKYYALVSGLAALTPEMSKPPYATEEYTTLLQADLSRGDKQLLEALCAPKYHRTVLRWLDEDSLLAEPSTEGEEAPKTLELQKGLHHVALAATQGLRLSIPKGILPYLAKFVYEHYYHCGSDQEKGSAAPALEAGRARIALEDKLSLYYYEWLQQHRNAFLRSWAELNQNIRNLLTRYTCQRLGWDAKDYIVGNNALAELLRQGAGRELELEHELPYLCELTRIAQDRDITRRERLIDLLKWQWMDEWTFVRVFDIDNVLCYYLRLEILERWTQLDAEQGEATFRSIVLGLKGESARVLDDFKRGRSTK